jgi:ABC-2 type transport system permease protein
MSALLAGFRAEARLLRRERAVWAALIALAAATLFSLYAGASRVSAQRELAAAARADEATRIDGLKKSLAKLASGESHDEPPPYRDPRNAIFMGGGPAARVMALPVEPLGLVAVGQSDISPPMVKVTTGSKDTFLFADEIENPAHLMVGSTDLAFIVVYVFPLVILALTFNLLAGEREQGTLALTLAAARRPGATLAGKFLARALAPIGVTLLASALGVGLFAGASALASTDFLRLAAVIVVYGMFWAALAAVVDGVGRSSAFNALTLVGVWAAVALIAPAAINSLASFVHPAPSRIDMTLAARAASTDADKARDAAFARYVDEHPGEKRGGAREGTLRRLAVQEAAFRRVEDVIAAHDAQLEKRRVLVEDLSFLSPTLLAYGAIADVAGAGDARYGGFLEHISAFHRDWRTFFLTRAEAGTAMTAADYDALPRPTDASVESGAIWPALLGMAAPTLLLAVFARRGFAKARP